MFALVGRVLFSAAASTLQKKLTLDGVTAARIWASTYALMALPAAVLLAVLWGQPVKPGFWGCVTIAGLLDALGNLAMVAALRSTHLSVFGPLNGLRPVLAFIFGWFFLGEVPSLAGATGVLLTVTGVVLLLRDEEQGAWSAGTWQMLGLRAAGLGLSTFAAVFLKRATLASSPGQTLGVWVLCGLPVFWLFLVAQRRKGAAPPRPAPHGWLLAAHAILFFSMQWLTLVVFRSTFLSYSFALFQLGMVLQVVSGHWLFGEPHFGYRLLCCVIIGTGALLVTLAL